MPSGRSFSAAAVPAATARPPVSLTRLVGREHAIGEIASLMQGARLVSLTGVGGCGKTRLAAEVAHRISTGQPAVWVELANCTDPNLVAHQIAGALSIHETSGVDATSALVGFLRERDALVVLDNCEHVIDACAEMATAILTQCPGVTMLTTSREPLGITGERVWPVPPLAVPLEEDVVEAISRIPAVELFVDRARSANPSFALSGDNARAVGAICRRLDGIPLAIELAAARIRVLSPEQIAARLDDRFALLSGAPRAGVPRHRTLRATIDWSVALLTDQEQRLLERLSVFAGPFSLDSVEAVCCDATIARETLLDHLGALVDKSLVNRTGDRFTMLETIAKYASERLSATGEADTFRRRHAAAFLELTGSLGSALSRADSSALERVDADRDNFRAALSWSIGHAPEEIGLPLAAALRWYWYYEIRWREGARWYEGVLAKSSTDSSRDHATVLTGYGTLTAYLGDTRTARSMLEESLAMWRALGDERELAFNLSALAQLLATAGDLATAEQHATESLALARRVGVPWDIGYSLANAAAFVAQARGAFDQADRYLAEAEAIYADPRHLLGLPFVLNARALLAMRRNDPAAAVCLARASLVETRERHELWFSSRSLRIIAFASTDPLRAAKLLGASACMLQTMTAGMLLHEMSEHDRLLESLHRQLPADAVDAALREGRSMSFDEACALALEDAPNAAVMTVLPAEPDLHVRDLGPLRITLRGKALDEARVSARAREMLLFLLAHPEGRTKEEVGVALWPDASTEQLKNSFHVTLHRLRRMLGSADVVTAEGGRYRIDGGLPHRVSSREFERAVNATLRNEDVTPLDEALALYEGDYLQGEEAGEWVIPIRAHLRQLYLRGLFACAQKLEARGRYEAAAERYRLVTAREPFHEAALRQLMVCRARLGLRSESLLLYRDLEQRLRAELETKPEPETMTLYRRLRENESV
ncbi:MAG: BTAD domain-containing putative transcriptional regulator [Thermoanaerobaculia bacterium]